MHVTSTAARNGRRRDSSVSGEHASSTALINASASAGVEACNENCIGPSERKGVGHERAGTGGARRVSDVVEIALRIGDVKIQGGRQKSGAQGSEAHDQ